MPSTPALQASSPATPAARPVLDCAPAHAKGRALGYACDALVRSQTRPAVAEAPAEKPQAPAKKEQPTAAKREFKLDPHVIPMALFGVGGTGLGVYLINTVNPLLGFAAIGVSMLVARSLAMSMAGQR